MGLVERGRAFAERQMLDTCSITRSGGEPVWDPAANDYVDPAPIQVYSGECRVKAPSTAVSNVEAGQRQVTIVPGEVQIPVVSDGYAAGVWPTDGDTVTVTAVDPSSDPSLPGQRFTVEGPMAGSQTTARRLAVEAVV